MEYLNYFKYYLLEKFNINDKLSNRLNDIAPFSKDNRPKSDYDIKKEKRFIKNMIKSFDDFFKTDFYQKYGIDFRSLVGNEIYFSKEVLESLTEEALNPDIYNRFKFKKMEFNTLNQFLLNELLSNNNEINIGIILEKIPNKINKQEIYYRFFKNFGNCFNSDLIKDILEIKQKIESKDLDCDIINNKIQSVFLKSMKITMDSYKNKMKKGKFNIIDTKEFFNKTLNTFKGSIKINDNDIKEMIIKSKLKKWYKYLENSV